jgi:hypothetical protein
MIFGILEISYQASPLFSVTPSFYFLLIGCGVTVLGLVLLLASFSELKKS